MAIKKKRKSKTNHSKKILSRKIKPKKSIKPHEIITFKYNSENRYDVNPLVYVLPPKNVERKKTTLSKTHIYGINLNYLTEKNVQFLLKETGVIRKSPMYVRLSKYDIYKNAIRTYLINDMSGVQIIEYLKDTDDPIDLIAGEGEE